MTIVICHTSLLASVVQRVRRFETLVFKVSSHFGKESLSHLTFWFTIYTDEIRSNSHISVTKYADDTAVSCNISKSSVETDQLSYQSSMNDI